VVTTQDGKLVVTYGEPKQAWANRQTEPPPLPIGVKASIDTIATVLGVDPSGLMVTSWEYDRTADELRWKVTAVDSASLRSAKITGVVEV
jgi:hypothetical protein